MERTNKEEKSVLSNPQPLLRELGAEWWKPGGRELGAEWWKPGGRELGAEWWKPGGRELGAEWWKPTAEEALTESVSSIPTPTGPPHSNSSIDTRQGDVYKANSAIGSRCRSMQNASFWFSHRNEKRWIRHASCAVKKVGRRKIRHSKCAVRKRWGDGKSVIQNVALGKGGETENPSFKMCR